MFDAYQVAVKVALHDGVSKGLLGISSTFGILGREVDKFQSKLMSIRKMALLGAGIGTAGFVGLDIFSKALKPAEEYSHLLNVMNMQGMTHKQIAEAVGAAWKTTNSVITSTITGNLKTFIDLKNIFRGNIQEAISYLPEFAKLQAVLGASSESSIRQNSANLAFSTAKALDIRGAINPSEFRKESEMMAKVIIATNGRVLPQDYQMAFKYGRQSTFGLSNEFLYKELPTLMLEMKTAGGGSGSRGGVGTSLAAGYRFVVQGIMTKASMEALNELGLTGGKFNEHLKTTTTRTILKHGVKGASLFQQDPFQWVQEILLPALHKKYGDNISRQDLITDINRLRMSQTAGFLVVQYALKSQQIYGDKKLIEKARGMNTAYQMALSNDPTTVRAALGAQWKNFEVAFMTGVIPILLPTLMKFTEGLKDLALIFHRHQALAKALSVGFFALFSSMLAVGSVLLVGAGGRGIIQAFNLIRIASIAMVAPLGLVAIGITALGVAIYELYVHWKQVEGFFKSFEPSKGGKEASNFAHFYNIPSSDLHAPIHVHTYLDSKEIAHSVSRVQAKESARQPSHGSLFNPNISLQPNMYNAGNSL